MAYAIDKHRDLGETEHHKPWIHNLLVGYYDPMYDYQLGKKGARIVFRGERDSVLDYLTKHHGIR